MRRAAVALAAAALLAGCAGGPAARRVPCEVLRVVDGDNVRVAFADGSRAEVRIRRIDAPERGQPFAREAAARLRELAASGPAAIAPAGADRYGRTLADLWAGGEDAGLALVREGLAWHYSRFDSDPAYAAAEAEARAARRGIWSLPDPLSPYDFRRSRRAARPAP